LTLKEEPSPYLIAALKESERDKAPHSNKS